MLSDNLRNLIQSKAAKRSGTQRLGMKCAEKICIAYETAVVSLKHLVLYREVNELDSNLERYNTRPYRDSEGFLVGIRYPLIYDSMAEFKHIADQYVIDGWTVERDSCHRQALKILDGEIVDKDPIPVRIKQPRHHRSGKEFKWSIERE